MMKETNIHSQVTSTIAGDDGEAMAKSEEIPTEHAILSEKDTKKKWIMQVICWLSAHFYVIKHLVTLRFDINQ